MKTALKLESIDVAIIDSQSTGKLEHVSHLISDNPKTIEEGIRTPNLAAIFEEMSMFFIKLP